MRTARTTRRERRLIQTMRDSAAAVITARKALRRAGDLVEARSKEISGYSDDGLELYDRVALTADDRLMNLRSARVWCVRVENEVQHIRAMLDRAIDLAEGENL